MKAFPHTYDQIIDGHVATCTSYGMDLRDWFAGLALQAFLDKYYPDTSVKKSYEVADAMMKAREKHD